MRERLIDGLIRGDSTSWGFYAGLWVMTTLLVLLHRPGHSSYAWALLAATTGTSLAGLPLATALSVPRLRWGSVEIPSMLASNSGETWRRLRGPSVAIFGPDADFAVPTIDHAERWVLVGMLSGNPIAGLPAAEAAASTPGSPQLCSTEGRGCRAWPVAWPDPTRSPALSEFVTVRPGPGVIEQALAYDLETGHYLVRIDPAPGLASEGIEGPHLELIGRPTGEAPHEGVAVLFMVRAIERGRLRAVRVTATPDPSRLGAHMFHVQHAVTSLTAGPCAFAWVARPLLTLTSVALPLGILLRLAALFVTKTRGRGANYAETYRTTSARLSPWMEAVAVLAAGIATAAPAAVTMASLWGSR